MTESKADGSPSYLSRARSYFSESVGELSKVSKPTKQETTQATIGTLVFVVILALFLLLLDMIFNQFMSAVLG